LSVIEPIVVGLLGITHPHASARVPALREIEGVEVVAAADDNPRLAYFTESMTMTFNFDTHDTLEWFESSRISVYGTAGMLEIGFLPQTMRVYANQARSGLRAGWTEWTQSHFTKPFTRTEQNKFSELPELENLSNFRTEMRGFVHGVRTGAPDVSPVADALAVARITDACYRSEQANGACVAVAGE
jgi:predicted dehydrogenase